jgi:hypothetical protein
MKRMRKPIERLAWELDRDEEIREWKLGQVAEKYNEPIERIMDALDVIKIAKGELSLIPPLDWRN